MSYIHLRVCLWMGSVTHRERPRGEPPRIGSLLLGRLRDDDLQRVDPAGQEPVDAERLCARGWIGVDWVGVCQSIRGRWRRTTNTRQAEARQGRVATGIGPLPSPRRHGMARHSTDRGDAVPQILGELLRRGMDDGEHRAVALGEEEAGAVLAGNLHLVILWVCRVVHKQSGGRPGRVYG